MGPCLQARRDDGRTDAASRSCSSSRARPIGLRIAWGGFYALAFIPLTYWIDRTAHRTYLRRAGRLPAKKA